MANETETRHASPLLNAAAYLTTLGVFLVAALSVLQTNDPLKLGATVAIFVAFTVIETVLMLKTVSLGLRRALFAVQGVLASALFIVLPGGNGIVPVLFVVLAAQAFFSFPSPEQLVWGGVYLAAIFLLMLATAPPVEAILTGMIYTGIYAFMWAVARALQREQIARAESQRLAAELEDANAQLREYAAHAQALAVAQERTRMAREIHDSLGHHLTVLSVQLQAAEKLVERDPARAREQIATARGVVAQALQDVRQSVNALRQDSNADSGNLENLPALVNDFGRVTGIATEYRAENFAPETLSPAQALTIYRAVQEGLTNAQKHAHATMIQVEISQRPNNVTVEILDDGAGNAENESSGYGLLGLRERVALLGGALQAGPRERRGFALRVEIPLNSNGTGT